MMGQLKKSVPGNTRILRSIVRPVTRRTVRMTGTCLKLIAMLLPATAAGICVIMN